MKTQNSPRRDRQDINAKRRQGNRWVKGAGEIEAIGPTARRKKKSTNSQNVPTHPLSVREYGKYHARVSRRMKSKVPKTRWAVSLPSAHHSSFAFCDTSASALSGQSGPKRRRGIRNLGTKGVDGKDRRHGRNMSSTTTTTTAPSPAG